jgi:D-3-phosphoglycerate dehydrogenase
MEKWRVILTDGLDDIGIELLKKEAEVANRKGITAEELIQEIGEYQAIIVRGRTKVTREVIAAAKNLKVIGRSGVGVDNIDLAAAEEKGIVVVNAPTSTSTAVAELAMGLIFALSREIPRADATMKNGEWIKKELMGAELNGKVLGILGFGRIGSMVGRMAAAVGMQILAYDVFPITETVHGIGGEPASIDELIEKSDVITIHTPLTDQTRNMIDAGAISRMKDGVYIVCTARGGIIDEKALLDALNSGKVSGAGLDVFSTEPPIDMELIKHPRVVATPHVGGQTIAAQIRASRDIAEEVLAGLRGDQLRWKVTKN